MTDQPPPEKQAPPTPREVRCHGCGRTLASHEGELLLLGHPEAGLRLLHARGVCRSCGAYFRWPGHARRAARPRPPEGRDPA